MHVAKYNSKMREARKRVAGMDETDGRPISDLPLDESLRTVMTAIQTGINAGLWDVVADAQVMLQQIELRHRPADQKKGGFYLMEDAK